MRHLWIYSYICFLYISCQKSSSESSIIQSLGAQAFKAQMEKEPGILLDVRTPEEVSQGCIPEAETINFYDKDFKKQIQRLDSNKAIYTYCEGGVRSYKAARILEEAGFSQLYNLSEGMRGWRREGLKTEKRE